MYKNYFSFKIASYLLIVLALSNFSLADNIIQTDNMKAFAEKPIDMILPQESITVSASGQADDTQGPNNTINGSGLNAQNRHSTDYQTMWLSSKTEEPNHAWIRFDFDQLYKLPAMLIWNYNVSGIGGGYGIKEAAVEYSCDGGQTWTLLTSVTTLPVGAGDDAYMPVVIDLGGTSNGIVADSIRITALSNWNDLLSQYGLSEVEFYYTQVRPTNPAPADNAKGVEIHPTLTWTAGEEAVTHKIFFGTDEQEVVNGTASSYTIADAGWTAPELILGHTYFWRVEEVNMAEIPSVWSGQTWSFTVQDYRVVDDFESCGAGIPANSWSVLSGTLASLGLETSIVNEGSKSMRLGFDNTSQVRLSEVNKTIDFSGRNWTSGSPKWLVFWIYGDIANPTTEKLYVKINSTYYYFSSWSIVSQPEIAAPWWTQVTVPLQADTTNLSSVSDFGIGFYRDGETAGKGFIFIDDIRLYNTYPDVIEPVNPGDANLIAFYKMENNTKDSSNNGLNGIAAGTTFVDSCYSGYGTALAFDGNDDYVDLGTAEPFNFTGSFSISFWAKIQDWSTDWSHTIAATRGEGMGFAIRKGSYWAGIFQETDPNGLAFSTKGIGLENGFPNPQDMIVEAPKLNTWTHIACIFDKANNVKKVYYNSKLVREAAVLPNETLIPSTAKASLGARANADDTGFENLFTGVLDDVRFYNKALSDGEVRFLADPTP